MSDDVISSCVRGAAGVGFEMDMESRCWPIVHGAYSLAGAMAVRRLTVSV